MIEKSCFNCKHFEIVENFHTDTGQSGFATDFRKCGWKYLMYSDTKENRWFFSNIYCNNWEMKND